MKNERWYEFRNVATRTRKSIKEVEVNALETQVNQTINYTMPIALIIYDIKKGTITDPDLSK